MLTEHDKIIKIPDIISMLDKERTELFKIQDKLLFEIKKIYEESNQETLESSRLIGQHTMLMAVTMRLDTAIRKLKIVGGITDVYE